MGDDHGGGPIRFDTEFALGAHGDTGDAQIPRRRRAWVPAWCRSGPCSPAVRLCLLERRVEADSPGDSTQMLVREPVAMAAKLPGKRALAEPLTTRGGRLAHRVRIPQQTRIRVGNRLASPGRCAAPLAADRRT